MNGGETLAEPQRKGQACELAAQQLRSQEGRKERQLEDPCATEKDLPFAIRAEQIAYV